LLGITAALAAVAGAIVWITWRARAPRAGALIATSFESRSLDAPSSAGAAPLEPEPSREHAPPPAAGSGADSTDGVDPWSLCFEYRGRVLERASGRPMVSVRIARQAGTEVGDCRASALTEPGGWFDLGPPQAERAAYVLDAGAWGKALIVPRAGFETWDTAEVFEVDPTGELDVGARCFGAPLERRISVAVFARASDVLRPPGIECVADDLRWFVEGASGRAIARVLPPAFRCSCASLSKASRTRARWQTSCSRPVNGVP
jgi:hypothetical protein